MPTNFKLGTRVEYKDTALTRAMTTKLKALDGCSSHQGDAAALQATQLVNAVISEISLTLMRI